MPEALASTVVGLEFLVPRIDDALAVFVDVLGFSLADRGRAAGIAADRAIITTGDIAITLIEAHEVGPGQVLVDRTPRLTQIVLGVAHGDGAVAADLLGCLGLPTEDIPGGGTFVAPEAMAGVIGTPTALVLTEPRATHVDAD